MQKRVSRAELRNVVALDTARIDEIHDRPIGRPIVRIHLLGSMRATTYVGENVLPRGRKARAARSCKTR